MTLAATGSGLGTWQSVTSIVKIEHAVVEVVDGYSPFFLMYGV
jgi:hypothetical protein